MSRYTANVHWTRGDAKFTDNRYSRRHAWHFDGGAEVAGSSSPHSVPLPYSDATAVDPEEAFVAAISSCHMLLFLSIAEKNGYRIDDYDDYAEVFLETDAAGLMWMTRLILYPYVEWYGDL